MLGPELSIIIISYNTKRELKDCLQSIYQEKDVNFEVIVADNHSIDSSAGMVRENFSNVNLIENKENVGFARAVNQGLRIAKGEFILLLNPDTKVTDGAIKTLVDFAKNQKDVGAVGPKLLNPDSLSQPSCYNLPSIKNAIAEYWFGKKGSYEKFIPDSQKPVEVEAIVGAAMLIPKKAIEEVGHFDERYFMYFEDLNWCRRAKIKGLKIFWHPGASIVHGHGVATSKVSQLSIERLRQSSKIYNGFLKYVLISLTIFLGQKIRRFRKIS